MTGSPVTTLRDGRAAISEGTGHMVSTYPGDSFRFTCEGRRFRAKVESDDVHEAPWDRSDGHGVVSDWTSRDKRPGEMILASDRGSHRFYDFAESTRIAKRDGWGLRDEDVAALASRLGRAPTRKEIVRESVLRDFDFLRAWCNDEWVYVGVVVHLLRETDDGDEEIDDNDCESLWGIESTCRDYAREVAGELASELLSRVVERERDEAQRSARAFADMARDVRAIAGFGGA